MTASDVRGSAASDVVGGLAESVSVASTWAQEVDRSARFPSEAVESLRENGLLTAAAPARAGGLGLPVQTMAQVAERLAAGCGSTAMVWAMHQIQLACLARHHPDSALLGHAVARRWLIASVTSETGTGGDLGGSAAGVEDGRTLRKHGTTVSYGAQADGYLMTARRNPDAPRGDQVAVLVAREQVRLVQTGEWNTLGMRGTCSPAFDLDAAFTADQVFPVPFGDIAARTMVPLSHVLWAAVWVGLADEAVRRAARCARQRGANGTTEPHQALALAHTRLLGARGQLAAAISAVEPVLDGTAEPTVRLGVELNALKVGTSETTVDVVRLAMEVCGMAGFSESGPHSVARLLRDAHSAPLMIGNRRLLATNAQNLQALRGER